MAGPLALSPRAHATLETFGREAQPVLSVDAALADPDGVLAIASRSSFRPIGPFYPGVRAPVPEPAAMEMVAPLAEGIRQAFGLGEPVVFFECFLSLVTTRPEDLAPIQRLPHFDGLEPDWIAVLLYLDKSERAGTAFFRQRATGFESVDAGRYDAYRRGLDQGVAAHGLPPSAYVAGDTPLFEHTHTIEGRFNRLVAYRSNTLHSGALRPDFVPVADPVQGRLTLNLFLRTASSLAAR